MCVSLDSMNEADEGEYGRPMKQRGMSEGSDEVESPIARQFGSMVDSMDKLERAWEQIHHKLGPIIGPPRPELAMKDSGEDREEMSDHAARLNNMADRMDNLREAILSLHNRIEL